MKKYKTVIGSNFFSQKQNIHLDAPQALNVIVVTYIGQHMNCVSSLL